MKYRDPSTGELKELYLPQAPQEIKRGKVENWDNLYTEAGTTIYNIYPSSGYNISAPSGAYLYGLLFVITGDTNTADSYANKQIFMTHNLNNVSENSRGAYLRSGTGAWIKLSGTEKAKATST